MFELKGKYTSAKVMIDDVDQGCISQIYTFLNHPAFINPIAIMPDCHVGKGAVIGFTMPITDKTIPCVIGVDIGCGMLSIDLGNSLSTSLDVLDSRIRDRVPFGFKVHDSAVINLKSEFPWNDVREQAKTFIKEYNLKFGTSYLPETYEGEDVWFKNKCAQIGANPRRCINSIGTLGGGNHFVEIGKAEDGRFWLTIHTGSRNFGKCVCEYWQNYAIQIVHKQKSEGLAKEINRIRSTYIGKDIEKEVTALRGKYALDNVSKQLCYLEGEPAIKYFFDMIFAQRYASLNRDMIGKLIVDIIDPSLIFNSASGSIESVHNFIDFRDFIVRKGAIRSYIGEPMVIPFNMRDGLLLCEGKSNPEWNFSAPHGAGRVFSRSAAKKQISLDDFKKAMEGIYSSSVVAGTLDESPMAYKDASIIEKAIEPTAKILFKVKPILNLKDSEGKEN